MMTYSMVGEQFQSPQTTYPNLNSSLEFLGGNVYKKHVEDKLKLGDHKFHSPGHS